MGRIANRPLNHMACAEADECIYAAHEADPRPNALYDVNGNRRPLDANDPEQAGLRSEWMDYYEEAGGKVSDTATGNRPPDDIEEDCPLGCLKVRVRTPDGVPIPGMTVTVTELIAPRPTNVDEGIADFGKVEPGEYHAECSEPWYLPETASGSTVVPERDCSTIDLTLDPVKIHLHLDANRDGGVDDDRTGIDTWNWGAGNKGAILLCNNDNDDDGSRSDLDNTDEVVNGGNDNDELAPVELRRTGQTVPPASWTAELSMTTDDASRARLFDDRNSGAHEKIGPVAGERWQISDLSFQQLPLGMEALLYANADFDGLVTLTLTVSDGAGNRYQEDGKLRVAPWMMPNHLDAAETVYVVEDTRRTPSPNERFRNELGPLVTAAGCNLQPHSAGDVWMQDCMEFGYASLPTQGLRTVMHPPRGRGLETFPRSLLDANLGYHLPATTSGGSTFDSNGNLEVTPGPVTSSAGKAYPWGRVYYGGVGRPRERFDQEVEAFLGAQIVQEPIEIDTSWLAVGHVDEIISFVPASSPLGFKLLLASPGRALDILTSNRAAHGTERLLRGRDFPGGSGWISGEISIDDILSNGLVHLQPSVDATEFIQLNRDIQSRMDAVRSQFETAIGIDPAADVVQVPILYFPNEDQPLFHDALTAGMVNMLVINQHCIVPKPFGPVVGTTDLFEQDLEDQLAGNGLTISFLDDWYEYHVALGEVHCGTNTLRTRDRAPWWEFQP